MGDVNIIRLRNFQKIYVNIINIIKERKNFLIRIWRDPFLFDILNLNIPTNKKYLNITKFNLILYIARNFNC